MKYITREIHKTRYVLFIMSYYTNKMSMILYLIINMRLKTINIELF